MLSLSRRIGEEVVIILPGFDPQDPAGQVVVQLVELRTGGCGRASLGFVAPANVQIYRREILDRPGFNCGISG